MANALFFIGLAVTFAAIPLLFLGVNSGMRDVYDRRWVLASIACSSLGALLRAPRGFADNDLFFGITNIVIAALGVIAIGWILRRTPSTPRMTTTEAP